MELTDKTALITGGTRGIGAATAVALAERGVHCALAARRIDDQARSAADRVKSLGRKCVLIGADVARPAAAAAAVQRTATELGGLDILIHCAGGPVNGGLLQITPETWHEAFNVHIHAIFHLCRAAIPLMRPKKQGAIILVGSVAGLRGLKSNIAYQAVKGAVPQITRALAFEFADDNIRVNCIAPGIVRTDFHAGMTAQQKQNNLDNRIPLHREGAPEMIATMVREMVTNDYMTGETVVVDGGLTMRIC